MECDSNRMKAGLREGLEMVSAIRLKFSTTKSHKRNSSRLRSSRLAMERLEDRRVLTSDMLGGVTGVVFLDNSANGAVDPGEEIANALVQLFEDTKNDNV
jgi:hypothetical protein